MAVLVDNARVEIWADAMRQISAAGEPCSIIKSDLRAAINALDDFLNTNATAVNNALPTAAKTGLTTAQKARLLMLVIQRRYVDGS